MKDRAGGGDDMKDRAVISHGAKQEDQDASRVNAGAAVQNYMYMYSSMYLCL